MHANLPGSQDEAKIKSIASPKTKERRYKSKHCEKSFRAPSGLKLHSVVHSNERPYRCSQCDKGF